MQRLSFYLFLLSSLVFVLYMVRMIYLWRLEAQFYHAADRFTNDLVLLYEVEQSLLRFPNSLTLLHQRQVLLTTTAADTERLEHIIAQLHKFGGEEHAERFKAMCAEILEMSA